MEPEGRQSFADLEQTGHRLDRLHGGGVGRGCWCGLLQCWTWLYLARLAGTDLTQAKHYAINEDGSAYDGDVGGPAFVDGDDGVELIALLPDQDAVARAEAQRLFSCLPRARARGRR